MLGFSEAHSQKPTASNRVLPFRAVANISLLLAIHSYWYKEDKVRQRQRHKEMNAYNYQLLLFYFVS